MLNPLCTALSSSYLLFVPSSFLDALRRSLSSSSLFIFGVYRHNHCTGVLFGPREIRILWEWLFYNHRQQKCGRRNSTSINEDTLKYSSEIGFTFRTKQGVFYEHRGHGRIAPMPALWKHSLKLVPSTQPSKYIPSCRFFIIDAGLLVHSFFRLQFLWFMSFCFGYVVCSCKILINSLLGSILSRRKIIFTFCTSPHCICDHRLSGNFIYFRFR